MKSEPENPQNALAARSEFTCPNCECSHCGLYCPECGQSREVGDQSLRRLLHCAASEITSSKSRTLHTFLSFVRSPGRVTREYLDGKRARYLAPFSSYLGLNILLYLLLTLNSAVLNADLEFEFDSGPVEQIEIVDTLTPDLYPLLGFFLLPIVAGILQLFYRRRQQRFGGHLVAALYLQASLALLFSLFSMLNLLIPVPFSLVGIGIEIGVEIFIVSLLYAVVFLILYLHRVYRGRLALNIARAVLIFFLYIIIFVLLLVAWLISSAYLLALL